MNKISKFFKFIYMKAIGDDIDTVKYMIKQHKEGKPIIDPEKKKIAIQAMKEVPKELFTKSWYWILAIIFVWCMGYLVGLEKAEITCNNFIMEEFYDSGKISPGFPILDGNISHEYSKGNNNTINWVLDPIG